MNRVETIGDCTLYLGKCEDILPTLGKFDAIVTDPPYEFKTSGGGIYRRKRTNMEEISAAGLDKGFDETLISRENCNSAVVFFHQNQALKIISHLQKEFSAFALCAWHKSNPMPVANKHYRPDTEWFAHFEGEEAMQYVHAWNSGSHPQGSLKQLSRYWVGSVQNNSDYDHPTVKPLALMEKIIVNVKGQLICDPYMGTGTTGLACMNLGRKFIGIEKEQKYFDIACKRLEEAHSQGFLFGRAI